MGFYGLCGWVIGLSFRGKRKRIQNPDMGLHGSAVTVVGLLVGRLLALSFVVLFFSAALAMQHQTETRGRVAPTHPDKPQGIFFFFFFFFQVRATIDSDTRCTPPLHDQSPTTLSLSHAECPAEEQ